MNLHCDLTLAAAYASPSQRARVLSESWFLQNAYCLACDSAKPPATPRPPTSSAPNATTATNSKPSTAAPATPSSMAHTGP